MNRDMELIRQIAFVVESASEPLDSIDIEIAGYTPAQIGYHCGIMKEAQLLHAGDLSTQGSQIANFIIFRLTWTGHDFVDAAKDSQVWNKVMKEIKSRVTSMAFDGLVSLLNASSDRLVRLGIEAASQ